MILQVAEVELEIEPVQRSTHGDRGALEWGIGRIVGASGRASIGATVIAPTSIVPGMAGRIRASQCFELPAALSPDRVDVVPQLAHALWVWECAGLELGEAAVYAVGSDVSRLIERVAAWRCGGQVIRLQQGGRRADDSSAADAVQIETTDPALAIEALSAIFRRAPGVVAAVCTANSAVINAILESAPMWARFVLATDVTDPATIDFYNNVHRKGSRILTVPAAPAAMFDEAWHGQARQHLERASRIMQIDSLAAACKA